MIWRCLLNFLIGEDEALNALGGGMPRETISGTVGRAVIAGRRWGPYAAYLIDGLLGESHCAREAAKEQARRSNGP